MPSEFELECWRWKLRLFASADLVGSTAYKAGQGDKRSPEWVSTFTEFFRDFPDAVRTQYDKLPKSKHCPKVSNQLSPWKFLGDEILFWVELQRHQDAASHILAFKNALREFPDIWRNKNLPLRLKGAAWLAGFPVTNREVNIPTQGGVTILDFIGPSMDLGFRIAKFCDERKFVLSTDLALMILDGVHSLEWKREDFYLLLAGKEVLKGVLGNEGYPIVYLHMQDGHMSKEEKLEKKLLGITHQFDWTDLTDYLRTFIDAREPRLFRPFIAGDGDTKYSLVPEEFQKLHDQMQTEESERGYAEQATQPEPKAAGPPREIPPPQAL
jgi:hypothetical protein